MKIVHACFIAAALATAGTAQAQSVEEFYKSHPITISVGFTAGGGYDLAARTVGRYINKYIPGTPTVIIQNMPGAGSLKSINYLYNLAPKDGSQLAVFSRGVAVEPLLGDDQAHFDPSKLNWIGSPSKETNVVFAWATKPFTTFQDTIDRQMVVSTTGSGADTQTFPLVLNNIFKTKFKLITGYPGAAETLLAVERGEADGQAGLSWGYIKASKDSWIKEKKINVLLQLALEKHKDLPDVPLVMDLVKSNDDRQLLELFLSRLPMAWPFAAPPDVPQERVAALRQAFDKTMTDPAFIAEAQRQNLEVEPMTGEAIATLMKRVYASSPEVTARARAIAEEGRKK
ncbi:MAG: Bug family tripartite tricarboxylate transporter substrate binding protein [Gemmatimonas sp.]